MAVITISRQYGSGGDQIADLLCQRLMYHQFDKRLIVKAAQEVGLSERIAVDYSEDTHKVQSFLERLFRNTASSAQMLAWTEDPSLASSPEKTDLTDLAVLGLVKRAVYAAWKLDNMVIVGRGGQVLLKDSAGVLHIRIEAPMEDRIQRIKGQLKHDQYKYNADIEARRMAQDLILKRDVASADYIKRYFEADWDDLMLYHAVLNTGKLTPEQAVESIVTMVHSMEPEPSRG